MQTKPMKSFLKSGQSFPVRGASLLALVLTVLGPAPSALAQFNAGGNNAARRSDAEKDAGSFKDAQVTLIRQSSNTGQLYGSVAVRDLVEALQAAKYKVTKSPGVLDRPIKSIGVYDVKVQLHPEVAVMVKVNVARSPEEAEMQAQGVDVIAQVFEEGRDQGGFTEDYDPNAEPGATAETPRGDREEESAEG